MYPSWFIMIVLAMASRISSTIAMASRISSTIAFHAISLPRNGRLSIIEKINSISNLSINLFSSSPTSSNEDTWEDPSLSGYKRASINWYPGHIASAERQLSETLKAVDVVIEVRDARIPTATAHPKVREWAAGKPRIVVFTRADLVPQSNIQLWKQILQQLGASGNKSNDIEAEDGQKVHQAAQAWAERKKYIQNQDVQSSMRDETPKILDRVEAVLYVDAKHGQGIHAIHRQVLQAGKYVNARRISRGLNPRPLRCGIMGYPNVGKSALINRILGQNRAKSADTPGVTRQLRWVKVRADDVGGNTVAYGASATDASGRSITIASASGSSMSKKRGEFELLDSPGIIPANMLDQNDALLLAACNSIGQAAYENQDVAAFLMERVKTLHLMKKQSLTAPSWRKKCIDRYGFDPLVPINNRRLPAQGRPVSSYHDEDEIHLPSGEDMIYMVAERKCQGDPETAARMILQDFRAGRLGPIALQIPDMEDGRNYDKTRQRSYNTQGRYEKDGDLRQLANSSISAKEMAEVRGIQLPPTPQDRSKVKDQSDGVIGRGLFEGW